jgi:thiosulfate/3-mercaptopyruvate sulfurtransferase
MVGGISELVIEKTDAMLKCIKHFDASFIAVDICYNERSLGMRWRKIMVTKRVYSQANDLKYDGGVLVSSLTVEELCEKLGNERITLLDTRASYVFNGWDGVQGQTGGHIPGAINFSASWLSEFNHEEEMRTELARFGILAKHEIVLYGEESGHVARELRNLGYTNIKIVEGGFEAWITTDRRIVKMDNYHILVHPVWLRDLMNYKQTDGCISSEFKVFEAGLGSGEDYKSGHIPGAGHIDTNEFEEAPIWNRKPDEEIEVSLLKNGITRNTMVILYGRDITAAARIAVILKYAGVEDVRILDGGYKAWVDAGLGIETGRVKKTPVGEFGARIPVNKDYIIDMEQAKAILAEKQGNLISIRSWAEYVGETSGYANLQVKGRIPGSLYGQDTAAYRNVDGTMFNYELLQENWCKNRIEEGVSNTFYCGTGWRAAETFIYADAMGWKNISLYDGGWHEWSSEDANPVEEGEPVGCIAYS